LCSYLFIQSFVNSFLVGYCPPENGYKLYRGRCLKLLPAQYENFTDAQGACAAEEAHLYYYKSLELDREALYDVFVDNGKMIVFRLF
jgi:hypothetical protein